MLRLSLKPFRYTVAAISALSLITAATGQTVPLKPKLEQGQTRYVERTTESVQSMKGGPVGPAGRTVNMKQTFGAQEAVESSSPGKGATLKLTFERVAVTSDAPMMDGVFDSDARNDDESEELGAIYEPMLGESIKLEIDKDAYATAASGTAAIVAKMEKSAGGNMMFDRLKRNITDEQNRIQWGNMRFMLYANKDVKTGDTWKRTFTNKPEALGEIVVDVECKVDSIGKQDGRDVAVISYNGTLKQAGAPKPTPEGNLVHIESGKLSGKGTFDIQRGEITSQTGQTDMKMKIDFGQGDAKTVMEVDNVSKDSLTVLTAPEREKQKAANKQAAPKKSEGEKKAGGKDK